MECGLTCQPYCEADMILIKYFLNQAIINNRLAACGIIHDKIKCQVSVDCYQNLDVEVINI